MTEPFDKEAAKRMLTLHEGVRLEPYKCPAGFLTIGIGRNLDANGISVETAEQMLEEDLMTAWEDVVFIFGRQVEDWSRNRKLALIDMLFNLGRNTFLQFQHTITHIEDGKWREAAQAALDSKWARQVPRRAKTIADMMRHG